MVGFKESYFEKLRPINVDTSKVYLKKNSFFKGYHIVTPIFDDDGKFNWYNAVTGGNSNLLKVILIVAFILLVTWSYKHDTAECFKIVSNQTYFHSLCTNFSAYGDSSLNSIGQHYNLSNFSIGALNGKT